MLRVVQAHTRDAPGNLLATYRPALVAVSGAPWIRGGPLDLDTPLRWKVYGRSLAIDG